MLGRLDHIAIAVSDLDAAVARYRDAWGFAEAGRETVASEAVEEAMMVAGDMRIQLIRPTDEHSGIARFIQRRGEGLHHIAFAVADLSAALAGLEAGGILPIPPAPRTGGDGSRVAFIHPRDALGVLVELVERTGPDPSVAHPGSGGGSQEP